MKTCIREGQTEFASHDQLYRITMSSNCWLVRNVYAAAPVPLHWRGCIDIAVRL